MSAVPAFDPAIPPTASPQVEFISLSHLNPSTELNPIPTRGIDLAYFRRYVQALEDGGYDYTHIRGWIERLSVSAREREAIFSDNFNGILAAARPS